MSVIGGQFFDQFLKDSVSRIVSNSQSVYAANGNAMKVRGLCEARFQFGGFEGIHTFRIVDDVVENVLLGNDFLKKAQVIIDMHKDVIQFANGKTETITAKVPRRYTEGITVHAMHTIVIPPLSGCRFRAKASDTVNNIQGDWIVEELEDIRPRNHVTVQHALVTPRNGIIQVEVRNWSKCPVKIYKGSKVAQISHYIADRSNTINSVTKDYSELYKQIDKLDLKTDTNLSEQQQKIIRDFLKENVDVFAVNPRSPDRTPRVKHTIDTGNHLPIKSRSYRIGPRQEEIIRREVKEMLENNVIRPSKSPWGSPVVLVTKPDGSIRFCVDYRKLNAITKKDIYPLPRIDTTLDRLSGMLFYSTIDLASGYWQIEIAEEDKEKTAFISPAGLYEFNVMPFGLTNAPRTFQRMMDEVVGELDSNIGKDYLDDVITGSKSFMEHLKDLKRLFDQLRKYGLSIKLSKCKFFKKELSYLGHRISAAGIKPDNRKISIVQKMPPPINIKQLCRFLGLTSYYRKFIRNYAKIAAPLTSLLQKGNLYVWNDDCQTAFETLKSKLINPPILIYPDFNETFILQTDASNVGIGAVLAQKKDGTEGVIAYASRVLTKAERNYSTTERECLAIIWGIDQFKPYLYGNRFIVETDHKALQWLMDQKEPQGRLARWTMSLQQYNFEIQYKKGKANGNADTLSRLADTSNLIYMIKDANPADEVRRLQRLDPVIKPIIDYLELQILPDDSKQREVILSDASRCELINGTLYYILPTVGMRKRNELLFRLVVPDGLKKQILEENHNKPIAGHLGIKKTYERISRSYYWKGMYKDVQEWVNICVDCAMKKQAPNKALGQAETIPVSRPMEIMGTDILGPLPRTRNGNKYILTFIDHFTKWVEAFAIEKPDAQTVAKHFVENIVCRFGTPEKLLSDRGKAFIGEVMTEVNRLLEVKQLRTSGYHPQTNGMTEQFNKTMMEMLSMFVSSHQRDWDEYLPYVMFAYRNSIHSSTQETLYFLMHLRNPNLPEDLARMVQVEDDSRWTVEEYKQDMLSLMERVFGEVREYDSRIRQKRERTLNQKREKHQFKIGDIVWLYTKSRKKGLSPKLLHPWHGPYRILDLPTPNNARLQTMSGKTLKQFPHVNRLKKYVTPTRPIGTTELELEETDNFDFDLEDVAEKKSVQKQLRKKKKKQTGELRKDPEEGEAMEVEIQNGNQEEELSDKAPINKGNQEELDEDMIDILDVRKKGKDDIEYLVHWKDKWDADDSWESYDFMSTTFPEKVGEFHKRKGLICDRCGYVATSKSGIKNHKKFLCG
jgi:hypothetical protein